MLSPGERRIESTRDALRAIFSARMVVAFFMGVVCGLPLLLTGSVLQAWMTDAGVDLTVIGLFALVGLPYTLKFAWAPILDRFTLPLLGRRRGWLVVAQFALILSITGLGMTEPLLSLWGTAAAAVAVAFFSASQDIVVDAYRREDLTDRELGLGSALYVNGYRVGMLVAGGGGLVLADHVSFRAVYFVMAGVMVLSVVTTVLAPEPEAIEGSPRTMREAVTEPFSEYFGRRDAVWILAFILFYKIGDNMAAFMATPFFLDIGFSKTEIGTVVKLFGFWGTVAGSLCGGVVMLWLGIYRALWVFGFLQAVSTAGFAVLATIGNCLGALAAVVVFENLASGMGTVAFVAFMASLTNKRFTATQYALLSSLMGVPRVLASVPTGFLAKHLGWDAFFILCALAAIPGLLLLLRGSRWTTEPAWEAHTKG